MKVGRKYCKFFHLLNSLLIFETAVFTTFSFGFSKDSDVNDINDVTEHVRDARHDVDRRTGTQPVPGQAFRDEAVKQT